MSNEEKSPPSKGPAIAGILFAFLAGAAAKAGEMVAHRYFSDLFKPVRCPECFAREQGLRPTPISDADIERITKEYEAEQAKANEVAK